MPILNTGQIFSSGDQVTSQKLMDIADLATFSEPADGSTIIVNNAKYGIPSGDGKLKVPDNGITGNELLKDATDDNNRAVTTNHIKDSNVTTAKIANSAVEFAKIQDISTAKVLGRTAAGAGVVEEVDLLDQDDMGGSTPSDTALATQQSIKAYVDNSIPNTSQLLKAKCTFDGTDTNPTVSDGFNVLSITKNAVGDYTVTFDEAITNPVASVTALEAQNTNPIDASIYSINQSTVRIITGTNTLGLRDVTVHLIVF